MPKPAEAEQAAQNEQLLAACEKLETRIESLMQDNAALREQLAATEQQAERLTALVDAEAEDLQPFGRHWFRPSAVVSITRDASAGVLINGSPMGWSSGNHEDTMDRQMREIAEQINAQNAQKRARAHQVAPTA